MCGRIFHYRFCFRFMGLQSWYRMHFFSSDGCQSVTGSLLKFWILEFWIGIENFEKLTFGSMIVDIVLMSACNRIVWFSLKGAVGARHLESSNLFKAYSCYPIELTLSRMTLDISLHNRLQPDFSIFSKWALWRRAFWFVQIDWQPTVLIWLSLIGWD